jgi:hypothetical protein
LCPAAGIGTSPEKAATATAAATAYKSERRRQAVAIRVTSSGTTHTQWWVHETGETSRPVMPQHATPAMRWPRRCAQAAMAIPARPVTTTAATHQGLAVSRFPASRATAPDKDWLPGFAGLPIRFSFRNTPPSQNARDCAGSTTKPAATVAAKVAAAVAAARTRRVISR